jgi:predicted TIM-barrel enzyme
MRRMLIVITAMATIACQAHAQEKTYKGNDLIEACRVVASGGTPSADNAVRVGACLGEIEALNWIAPGVRNENLSSCAPDEISKQQLAKIVVDYLDQNPDRRTEPFEGLALEAFAHKWPCPTRWFGWFGR